MPRGSRGETRQHSLRTALTSAAVVAALLAFGAPVRAANQLEHNPFPRPAELEPNINFWVNTFTYWGQRDFVIHDRDQLWRVYQVFHMPGQGVPDREEVEWANAYLKAKYTDILNRLASGRPAVGYEEERVAAMFKGQPPSTYAAAAQNLRVQQGLREPFHDALLRSRYYRPRMERVFEAMGLPPELVTLAAVESGFSSRARSSAGAVGIWQFTRATGREFMRITRYRDDRLDPVRSTEAAARLLQANYEALGSWPLAITAYDYGTAGMSRAAAAYGSNFVRIIEKYDAPHFGFAVKNYYAEFLAALQVNKYQDKYFPGIQHEEAPPPRPSSPILRRVVHHVRRHHGAHLHRVTYHHRARRQKQNRT
ncbi:MAG TPA: lytic transglycosylase domain-containing protein [Candidatus Binataceae bacterium]|nr:lytic transglycosylase domain-containing protein [Candidatus Binataceae bacterium]